MDTSPEAIDPHTVATVAQQQFDHFVDDVPRLADLTDWPTVRCLLHQALVAAWGLDAIRTDRHPQQEAHRRTVRLQAAYVMIDRAYRQADPATDWPEFRDVLWCHRDLVMTPPRRGR